MPKNIDYLNDIREAERVSFDLLNEDELNAYISKLKEANPNLAYLDNESIYTLAHIKHNGSITLFATLLFSLFPQVYYPRLCITAVVVPGTEMGDIGINNERFLDNELIEGTIQEMLNKALHFVKKNMKYNRASDYPIAAIREAILNALMHRDYSVYAEGAPIQIVMYEDRMEIINPIGRNTRNPALAAALEILGLAKNKNTGIITIREEMKKHHLREPEFLEESNSFIVKFYKENK